MKTKPNNYAFIDAQNVYRGILSCGWKIDWDRFRVWLKDKFEITHAYIFIGYLPGNENLYAYFQKAGFICIFKPILEHKDGTIKGNVDAELVLYSAAIEYARYDKAVIVSGDGDFACLVDFLKAREKLEALLVPSRNNYSSLLKRCSLESKNNLYFISDQRVKLEYKKEKASNGTKPN